MLEEIWSNRGWRAFLGYGLALQLLGFVIATTAWRSNNSFGVDRHSFIGTAIGFATFWVGLMSTAVGIIALGIVVAKAGWTPRPVVHSVTTQDVAADSAPFGPHPDDSETVAEVRALLRRGVQRSQVRRTVRKAAREQRLDHKDHPLIEALLDEAERRAAADAVAP